MALPDQERLSRIQRTLREENLDAFVLFHPEEILMATGMLPGSSHVVAIVDADGKVAVLTPWWRESFVADESWADKVDCFDWCRPLSRVDPDKAVIDWLRRSQSQNNIERIGADLQLNHYGPNKTPSEYFSYQRIKAVLPSIFRVSLDASDRINQLKAIKTSQEIDRLRISHEVIKAGVKVFYQEARPGIREIDLATEVNCAVLKMVGYNDSTYVFCEQPQITSGPERTMIAYTLSNYPTRRRLQEGDLVLLELGAPVDGYWADITRATVIGVPNDIQKGLHRAVLEAQSAAITAYVPGRSTGKELCEAAWRSLRDAGFKRGITHFLGHGLGFSYHEDRPTLGPEEHNVISPGHVTSIEPGLYWREGGTLVGGVRVEENVVWGVSPGKVEILSDFYRDLENSSGAF